MRAKLIQENESGRTTIPKGVLDRLGLVDEDRNITESTVWVEDVDEDEGTTTISFEPLDDD